jgi:hypothetical protein
VQEDAGEGSWAGRTGRQRRAPPTALCLSVADETNNTEKAGRPEHGWCWGAWPRGDGARCTPGEPVGGEPVAGAGSLGGGVGGGVVNGQGGGGAVKL